ncbi:MAG: PLP-dependent aminotransferase family protein [Nevskia sp.]|nr:PLP-dependent aminotransferase family protein [Nevskia sp.]
MSRLPECPTTTALAAAAPDVIALAWGVPAPGSLPTADLQACLAGPLTADALQYGELLGAPRLRELLRQQLAARGILAAAEQIAILTGGCLGIELFARLLVGRGEAVLLESPAFSEAIRIFRAYSDHLVPVAVDEDGLVPEALAEALAGQARRGVRARLLYLVPHAQNPSGATLTAPRRARILELATAHDLIVIEDDPYYLLSFANRPLAPLRALDDADRVVYLDSFSKTLAPGLRVGWAVVPRTLLAPFLSLKQACDFSPNPFAQEFAFRFCAAGHLEPHVAYLRGLYRARKDALLQAVRRHLPQARVRVDPPGGFFLWLDLPADAPDTQALLPRALAAGVSFIPGPTLDPLGGSRQSLRLSYSYESPERMEEGVRRLACLLRAG